MDILLTNTALYVRMRESMKSEAHAQDLSKSKVSFVSEVIPEANERADNFSGNDSDSMQESLPEITDAVEMTDV